MRTDEDLALAIQQGNKTALAELVRRHHSQLIGYLYRMSGGDRSFAEDTAQEAFLRVIRSIDSYSHPRPFKTWLYAIATNLVRDHFKRAERRYVMVNVDEIEAIPSSDRTEIALEHDSDVQEVINALMNLPEHQRAVVVLRYYEDLPLADIAMALDIPVGTVKSRLSLGLKKLKVKLERSSVHE